MNRSELPKTPAMESQTHRAAILRLCLPLLLFGLSLTDLSVALGAVQGQGDSSSLNEFLAEGICPPGECCPPSTQQKVVIGVGTLALAAVCFFLLVRLMERRFISQDKSALMGRHSGFSLGILISALGMAALGYYITGCFHSQILLWLAFAGVLWAVHGIYTLIVIRGT